MMTQHRVWLPVMVFVVCAVPVVAAGPTVISLGGEVGLPGSPAGMRPDIAVDSKDQPHIFADINGNPGMVRWHRIGNSWQSGFNTYTNNTPQWYNPRVEINQNNQLWVSGVRWWSEAMRVMVFNTVDANPTLANSFKTTGGYNGLPVGNLSLDPTSMNEATVYAGNGCFYERYRLNGTNIQSIAKGTINAGLGGEKNFYWMSKAAKVQHAKSGLKRV